jgi:hypothetical protein
MPVQNDNKLLKQANAVASFKTHAAIYLLVTGLQWVVWFFSGRFSVPVWPVYPTLAWGVVLLWHYRYARSILKQ